MRELWNYSKTVYEKILPFFFFLVILMQSLQHIPRWDLLDQIAVADRFVSEIEAYPAIDSNYLGGVSVYFPGVALIGVLAQKLVPSDFLVVSLLVFATIVTFSFIFIQKIITSFIDKDYIGTNFWPMIIIISGLVARDWLYYSIEFKPDTIAFLLGFSVLIISRKVESHSYLYHFFLGLIFGSILIFKQQYIAFILGYAFFALVIRRAREILFLFGALTASSAVVFCLWYLETPWFWTVEILADDGFLGPLEWIDSHLGFGFVLCAGFLCFVLIRRGHIIDDINKVSGILKENIKKPWLYIILPASIAAFLGSFKVGGNSGNTALSIMLLSPLILILSQRLNYNLLLLASIVVMTLNIKSVANTPRHVQEIIQVRAYVEDAIIDGCGATVIGSNVYYAVRDKLSGCEYENYWTHSLLNNSNVSNGYEISSFIHDERIKYFVIENLPVNLKLLKGSADIELLFVNDIAIVAQRKGL